MIIYKKENFILLKDNKIYLLKWVVWSVIIINIIDDDYKICYKCYLYYDKHNPKVIDDFENNSFKLTKKK